MATVISAEKVLSGARRAQPFNLLKLADRECYEKVPYEEFFSVIVNHPKKEMIEDLLSQCKKMELEVPEKYEKIYIYFLISLHQIVYEG